MGWKTYRSGETRKWPSRAGMSSVPERNPCLIRLRPSRSRQTRQGHPVAVAMTPHCLVTELHSSSRGQSASTQQQELVSFPAVHVLDSILTNSTTTDLFLDLMLVLATSDFAFLVALVTYSFGTIYARIVTDLTNYRNLMGPSVQSYQQSSRLLNSVCQILW